jgi:hypothetical protein
VRTIIHNSQTDQLSRQFVEQKNYALFEQKNTVPKRLNSYNFAARLDYNFLQPKKSEACSIVSIIALRPTATKEYSSSSFMMASP